MLNVNRDYRVVTSLENAGRIERSVFEYRKLVLGLIARMLVSWSGGEEFFIAAVQRAECDGAEAERDIETIEKLFCFPTKVPHPQSYDFARFAYNCPQYYLRQAIVAALGGIEARAKYLVRPHYEESSDALMVTDLLNTDKPWFSLFRNEQGLCFNLDTYNAKPFRNFWSDLDEVFREPVKDGIYNVRLFDSASRSWIWCELSATHGTTDDALDRAFSKVNDPEPILVPDEMIRWHATHLSHDLWLFSSKTPNFMTEKEFQVFKGIELAPSFVEWACAQGKVSQAVGF